MKLLTSLAIAKPQGRSSHSRQPVFAWGLVLTYLGLLVALPIASLFWKTSQASPAELWNRITDPVAVTAYVLSFSSALLAALINSVFGFILAWILVRHQFPGRRLADGLVDLPFAIPGVVAGITLLSLYGPGGLIGQWLDPGTPIGNFVQSLGISELNLTASFLGLLLAQTFSSLPFVVRTVQPILLELEPEVEEVAYTLGASSWQSFWRVLFPQLLPAILTGFTLALARGVGEFGIIFMISGNIPFETLVSTVYIFQRLEEFDFTGATAVAIVLLAMSLVLLGCANGVQRWSRRWELNDG
jgi:sulfate transport system permease protein